MNNFDINIYPDHDCEHLVFTAVTQDSCWTHQAISLTPLKS